MSLVTQYEKNKENLLNDKSICKANRDLFQTFFENKEKELRRKRKLGEHINEKVAKTLLGYTQRLRNVNSWFENKEWKKLTEEDIQRVYDDLEDGKIKNRKGKPFEDKLSYYNKIFKSKPFELVNKDHIAKKVIVSTGQSAEEEDKEVRFIRENDFIKARDMGLIKFEHKAAVQLGWDTTENISTILETKAKDYTREIDPETNEPSYNVVLRKEILKTSRTKRTEPTLYPETVEYLDILLKGKNPEDKLFSFDLRAIEKAWYRAVKKVQIFCEPNRERPLVKDIRSGAMCDLLIKGWTTDEIKARAGHKPSSKVIDKYVNYLAINKDKSKKKIRVFEVQNLKAQIQKFEEREKLQERRISDLLEIKEEFKIKMNEMSELVELFQFLKKSQENKATQEEFLKLSKKEGRRFSLYTKS